MPEGARPMPAETAPITDAAGSPPPAAIGHLAIRGMMWTLAQTVGSKAASMLQQIIIAKLFLKEEDFGLVAIAQVVISFTSLGQNLGIGEILVRRHRYLKRWIDAGFWLNFTMGLLGMVVVWAVAAAWVPSYEFVTALLSRPREAPPVVGLLLIWSLYLPIDGMVSVLVARLRVDMRFRLLAILNTCNAVGTAVLGVALAVAGFKAYSIVIPVPVFSMLTLLAALRLSGQRIRWRANVRRWGTILRDARYFFASSLFSTLFAQGDYLVTGAFFSPGVLGAYYWAYRMSTQTAQFVGANLMSVLVPSFAKLEGRESRQVDAYRRTAATLILIGLPLCGLQALLAEPAFHLVFGEKWDRALPLFIMLSIGMGFTLPMTSATSLLLAQGRYALNMAVSAVLSLLFIPTVVAGALCGSVWWVAAFVSLYYMIFGPLTVMLPVLRAKVSGPAFLVQVYAWPVIITAGGMAAGWGVAQLAPGAGSVMSGLLRLIGWLAGTGMLLAVIRPASARELVPQVRRIAGRVVPMGIGRP